MMLDTLEIVFCVLAAIVSIYAILTGLRLRRLANEQRRLRREEVVYIYRFERHYNKAQTPKAKTKHALIGNATPHKSEVYGTMHQYDLSSCN